MFVIDEGKHSSFTRDGDNLKAEVNISLKQALLGFNTGINHLDSRILEISRDGITQPGFTMKMVGEGMPLHQKSGEFGDLFINFKVEFPNELNSKQKESKFYAFKFF